MTVAILLAVLDWPVRGDVESLPAPLDLLLAPEKDRPQPELAAEIDEPDEPDEAEQPGTLVPLAAQEAPETPARDEVMTSVTEEIGDDRQREIDWQASLERASADTVEAHATPDSLHPAFDELRRIAAVKYAPPRTGKPPPIWENVEEDIYGRKLLRHGDCFRVIDDMNVGNRYAFETFEQYLVFCEWRGEKRQEFPWIETIVARYPYLREPDGGLAAIDTD